MAQYLEFCRFLFTAACGRVQTARTRVAASKNGEQSRGIHTGMQVGGRSAKEGKSISPLLK